MAFSVILNWPRTSVYWTGRSGLRRRHFDERKVALKWRCLYIMITGPIDCPLFCFLCAFSWEELPCTAILIMIVHEFLVRGSNRRRHDRSGLTAYIICIHAPYPTTHLISCRLMYHPKRFKRLPCSTVISWMINRVQTHLSKLQNMLGTYFFAFHQSETSFRMWFLSPSSSLTNYWPLFVESMPNLQSEYMWIVR